VIEIKEKSKQLTHVIAAQQLQERDVPEYITVDGNGTKVTFLRTPKLEDVPYAVQMEPNLVVEFYSR
jgi:small subunit ribosomal protein S4